MWGIIYWQWRVLPLVLPGLTNEKCINSFLERPSKIYTISAATEHCCSQKLWSDSRKIKRVSIIDVGRARAKLCKLVPSFILKGTNLTWIIGQCITPFLFNPSNWSKLEQLRTLKSGTNRLPMFHNTPLTGGWIGKRNHNTMLWLFTVLILGRSKGGIFKQRVNKVHSVGTRAALGNCLPYKLDTANKLPTTPVLTKPAGGKEINFNARG